MIKKRNIFIIGPMGAGKSTIGLQLSQQLNMEFYDSDYEIEKRTGVNINWVFEVEGEEGFRKREKKIINEIAEKNGVVLATGGGSVKSKETRILLSSRGIVIYLKVDIEKQLIRTQYGKNRPLLQSNNIPRKILELLANERNPMYKEIADITICTDHYNIKIITNKIINLLKNIC